MTECNLNYIYLCHLFKNLKLTFYPFIRSLINLSLQKISSCKWKVSDFIFAIFFQSQTKTIYRLLQLNFLVFAWQRQIKKTHISNKVIVMAHYFYCLLEKKSEDQSIKLNYVYYYENFNSVYKGKHCLFKYQIFGEKVKFWFYYKIFQINSSRNLEILKR